MKYRRILSSIAVASAAVAAMALDNIAEEVAWVVGDEPIYKSEIEEQYQGMLQERIPIKGDPYCVIPEQMALEKLFLHQAEIDTVEVAESQVQQEVDARINYLIANLGSREKVEQYFNKPLPVLREQYTTNIRNHFRVQQVQQNLTKDLKITPSDVRRYFNALPVDSLPYVPLKVEVQVITLNPAIPRQEIEDVKSRLRDLTDRINRGDISFTTAATLYSEAPEAKLGGEIGFMGRGQLVPEYAAVAFNLNDPKKISKIVETEYGFHIIQLIEKRGDRINTRHILMRPKVSYKDLSEAIVRLDSVRTDILDKNVMTFGEAARYISQDKDTRNSNGVMVNQQSGTTRFEMSQLPREIAWTVDTMKVGQVSQAFIMKDPKSSRDLVAIVRLTNRIEAHKANLADDYQQIKDMYENAQRTKIINDWIANKIRNTYVRIEDGWRNCEFEHEGWIRTQK